MREIIERVGVGAAGATLGAVILPNTAASLVGGYGMIAAAGAVSAGFGLAFSIGLLGIGGLAFAVMSKEQQDKIIQSCENHPILLNGAALLLFSGAEIAGIFVASLIMGQAFLPLLACTLLGSLIVAVGMLVLKSLCGNLNQENNQETAQSHRDLLLR